MSRPARGTFRQTISIHALREEGDWLTTEVCPLVKLFLSTPSARRATTATTSPHGSQSYFYPRPPRGGRHWSAATKEVLVQFLSTPSARRATSLTEAKEQVKLISIHALREEGDSPRWFSEGDGCISIHALREEGDAPNRG